MNLYDIDSNLETLIEYGCDPDTGEILDATEFNNKLDEFNMELDKKISDLACYIKSLKAEAEAIKQEKLNLAKRQKSCENKAEGIKNYLDNYFRTTQGENFNKYKFKDPRVSLGYRKSKKCVITNSDLIPKEYIKDVEVKFDLKEIKKDIQQGKDIEGAEIQENINLSIR
jgi:hypothetical protein